MAPNPSASNCQHTARQSQNMSWSQIPNSEIRDRAVGHNSEEKRSGRKIRRGSFATGRLGRSGIKFDQE